MKLLKLDFWKLTPKVLFLFRRRTPIHVSLIGSLGTTIRESKYYMADSTKRETANGLLKISVFGPLATLPKRCQQCDN